MADEDEEDQGTVVTLRYGPMWLGGKLRYSLTRIQALRREWESGARGRRACSVIVHVAVVRLSQSSCCRGAWA